MYWFLALINLVVFAVYFHKDPVAATAIFIGITVALAVGGIVTFVEKLIKRKENHQ